jgi:hypothetical protein
LIYFYSSYRIIKLYDTYLPFQVHAEKGPVHLHHDRDILGLHENGHGPKISVAVEATDTVELNAAISDENQCAGDIIHLFAHTHVYYYYSINTENAINIYPLYMYKYIIFI